MAFTAFSGRLVGVGEVQRPSLNQLNTFSFSFRRIAWRPARHSCPGTGVAYSFFKFGSPAPKLPDIVKAGDPVLTEPASAVPVADITTPRIQKIITDMISLMRAVPAVGLSAPQIGIPLQIIVLEDTKEYISYVPKKEADAQQRSPFDLLVICNPALKKQGTQRARFFEGCLSMEGYRGLVERHLEVEVSGFGRDGSPIKVKASGWQARVLQHECHHLQGVLYVEKLIPKTFRTNENLRLPLPSGCPKLGRC
ncbi:hypothetical protein L7F22_059817 [Adiantum nelumboides]|nr:hypothetical protein [Adiantum nelumboides]